MSKEGLLTKDEEKFYGKLIAGEINVGGIFGPIVKWGVPYFVATLDNKYGDKIPEPWQTYIERLTTMFHAALGDGHIDETERTQIGNYCVVVMNAEIDLSKKWDEHQEAVKFMAFWKFIATLIWGEVQEKPE